MVEWFKAAVLKTAVAQVTEGSNPSLSAILCQCSPVVAYPLFGKQGSVTALPPHPGCGKARFGKRQLQPLQQNLCNSYFFRIFFILLQSLIFPNLNETGKWYADVACTISFSS